jgi:hypothetical protein
MMTTEITEADVNWVLARVDVLTNRGVPHVTALEWAATERTEILEGGPTPFHDAVTRFVNVGTKVRDQEKVVIRAHKRYEISSKAALDSTFNQPTLKTSLGDLLAAKGLKR